MDEQAKPESFLRRRLIAPVLALLTQGLSPERIALTFAVGVCLAAFPLIGATTFLCTVAALALRLNMPLIQVINYFGAPLQLGLLIPLMRLGGTLFGGPQITHSLREIVTLIATRPAQAFSLFWMSTLHAMGAWAIVSPVAGLAIYLALLPVLREAARRLPPRAAAVVETGRAV